VEGRKREKLTSASSLTVTLTSFFGLRPGFGFAGITHSLEAKERKKRKVNAERERQLPILTDGPQL